MSQAALNLAHCQLHSASLEIGGICEMASWASEQIAEMVLATGKTVDDLTVAELRQMITDHGARVREIYK